MDLKQLDVLKQKLLTASEFADVLDYFYTHFGEHREFIAMGDRVDHPMLEAILGEIVKQFFPEPKVGGMRLTRLDEPQFIHGGFTVNRHLANVIYFEDICKGLLAVVTGPTDTKIIRFSGQPLPPGWSPENN